jgi:putative inorganic carbon (hco3(-)) transporter
MRDVILACVVFGALPFMIKRPFIGILMLAWLGYMNPHLLAWGFMHGKPLVQVVVLFTFIGMLVSKEPKRMIWSREIIVLLVFVAWMVVTTWQAFYPHFAIHQLEKVVKIQILTVMTLLMLTSRERVHLFVWVIVLSLGFYGVKGGIFTILNGGAYRVQGPSGSFIGGNNELALALVMTVPLVMYLYLTETRKPLKYALGVGMALCAIAAVGSQSRGALVALLITGSVFWLKSRQKLFTLAFVVLCGTFVISFMPTEWFDRMSTIKTYDEDLSAIGRINAWWTAFHLANDRVFGGGFETWQWQVFEAYAPDPNNVRDVHSIYFEVLGEHGYIGLGLFLLLLGLTWLKCGAIVRFAKKHPEHYWARDLASMIQVSLLAYMSAGAFLGLAYFDYPYHLIALAVVVHHLIGVKRGAIASESTSVGSDRRPASAGKPADARSAIGRGVAPRG